MLKHIASTAGSVVRQDSCHLHPIPSSHWWKPIQICFCVTKIYQTVIWMEIPRHPPLSINLFQLPSLETNSSHLKLGFPKKNVGSQTHPFFRGKLALRQFQGGYLPLHLYLQCIFSLVSSWFPASSIETPAEVPRLLATPPLLHKHLVERRPVNVAIQTNRFELLEGLKWL